MFQCGDRLPEIKISLRMCDRMANFINDVASGRSRASREADGEERVARCREMAARSAERAAKAMRGEMTEDVSKWIFEWDIGQNPRD